MPTTIDRTALAAELHAYADALAAGTEPVPAMRRTADGENTLKVVPRVMHNVLCSARVATPQDTDPVVLACVHCGLCYPVVTDTATTAGICTEPNCSTKTDLRCDGPTGAGCGELFCRDHLFVTERDGDLCASDYQELSR